MFEPVINFDVLLPLIIDIAVLIFLSVQGFKVFQLVKEGQEGRFALVTAFVFGVLFAVREIVPTVEYYIDLFVALFAGTMTAGLFYRYFAKPIFEKLGLPISVEDLS